MPRKKTSPKRDLPRNVYARENGKFQVKFSRKGFRIDKWYDDLASAERYAVETRIAIDAGDYQDGKKERETTLCDLCDRYEEKRTPAKKGAKQERSNLNLIRREEWAKFPVKSVRSKHIADYRNRRIEEGKAPSTINNIVNLVSSIFTWAITEQNYDLVNPVTGLKRVKANPGRDVRFVMGELGSFLHECEEQQSGYWWLIFFIKLQLLTAMRQGEVRRLRWQDLKKTSQGYAWHLEDTKNGEDRDVPLLPEAEAIMHELKKVAPKNNAGWVFGDPDLLASEGGISTDLVTRLHREAADRSGYKGRLTNHDLRHIACTMLAKFYPNALALSKVTGHKTLSQLRRYYNQTVEELVAELHLGQRNRKRLEEDDRKASEADKKKDAEEKAELKKQADDAQKAREESERKLDAQKAAQEEWEAKLLAMSPEERDITFNRGRLIRLSKLGVNLTEAKKAEAAKLREQIEHFYQQYPHHRPKEHHQLRVVGGTEASAPQTVADWVRENEPLDPDPDFDNRKFIEQHFAQKKAEADEKRKADPNYWPDKDDFDE